MVNFCKFKKKRAAFTLVELVITIALFLLVAGLVTAFISFMGNFSATREQQSLRVKHTEAVRSEIDYWFSYFDRTSCTMQVFPHAFEGEGGDSGSRVIAQATDSGLVYRLRIGIFAADETGETERAFVAEYPSSAQHGTAAESGRYKTVQVGCDTIARVVFQEYSENWSPVYGDEALTEALRFTISGKVNKWSYACTIFYA